MKLYEAKLGDRIELLYDADRDARFPSPIKATVIAFRSDDRWGYTVCLGWEEYPIGPVYGAWRIQDFLFGNDKHIDGFQYGYWYHKDCDCRLSFNDPKQKCSVCNIPLPHKEHMNICAPCKTLISLDELT